MELLHKQQNFFLSNELTKLKCKLNTSNSPISLFGITPEGKDFFEIQRLFNEYGYYYGKGKRFKGSAKFKEKRFIGIEFQFSLNINYDDKRVILEVYNRNNELIDNNTHWDFNQIETALVRKINYLALIKVSKKEIAGEKYYKYNKMYVFKLKSFETFLDLIKDGIIYVNFSIDTYNSGYKNGQIHDHGTYFSIFESNLYKLFDIIE